MKHYIIPALRFARLQSIRLLRDPVGTIILFGLPMILLIVFGAFMSNTDSLSLNVALVNDSSHALGSKLEEVITATPVFNASENHESLDAALSDLRTGNLDVVLYLTESFGYSNVENADIPPGNIELFVVESRGQTGDIA